MALEHRAGLLALVVAMFGLLAIIVPTQTMPKAFLTTVVAGGLTGAIAGLVAANIPMAPINGFLAPRSQAGATYQQIAEFCPAPDTYAYKTVIWPGREEMPIGPLVYFPDGEPDEEDEIQGCRYCIEGEPYPDWETPDDFELEMAITDPDTCWEHGNMARNVWTPRNDACGVHQNPGPDAIFF